jgi:hypothetical protein
VLTAPLLLLNLEAKGIDSSHADLLTGTVASELERYGEVLTRDQLELSSSPDADRCDPNWLDGIAKERGAKAVVFGSFGLLGELFIVNLSLVAIDSADGSVRETIRTVELAELDRLVPEATRRLLVRAAENNVDGLSRRPPD